MPANSSDVHFWYTEWEDSSTYASRCEWLSRHPLLPLIAVSLYGLVIRFGPRLMATRSPVEAKIPLFVWNTSLAVFSLVASIRGVCILVHDFKDFDLKRIMCVNDLDNVSGFWSFGFAISKLVELGDTLFLILRKKRVLFLHWFHHVTVLLFTWLATAVNTPTGKFFSAINVVVHSLMYSYYALTCIGVRVPRLVSMTLTVVQISQMVTGMTALSLAFVIKSRDATCYAPTVTLIAGGLMYASYFVLFVQFFLQAYVTGKQEKKKQEKGKSQ